MHRNLFAFVVGVLLASVGLLVPPSAARATVAQVRQAAAGDTAVIRGMLGRSGDSGFTLAELLDRLRQSGITRAEARVRLMRIGVDPGLVDPYFDVLESGGEPPRGAADARLLDALGRIGVPVVPEEPRPDTASRDVETPDTAEAARDPVALPAEPRLAVFGRSVFERSTSEFSPVLWGPVDPDYRLGPGDEVALILTGDVEASWVQPVTREGFLVIPDVGQVFVNGLTLAELEDRLYARLGRVYSGVRRGSDATTHFQVTLGRLRPSQVYVVGEVERPGAYQVNAAATVFNALYRAGGPSENGSFRAIEVYRGGEHIATVDLYDYLLRGRSDSEIRLRHGDRIFVPPFRRRVAIRGAVRRPAIYELNAGDGLREALAYAGGLSAEASTRRIQIDRILAPTERRPGVDRVLIDVELRQILRADGAPVPLRDGDVVEVFAVSDERRNRIVVTGEVQRPGIYEWSDGLTLWELIDRADGLAEGAYTPRAHVFRLVEDTGSRRVIRVSLSADSSGAPARNLVLADRDSVVIFSRAELRNAEFVTIDGFVKKPGTYRLADGMTVQDLVLAAGGFVEGADRREAEVARRPALLTRGDTTAVVIRVPLPDANSAERAAVKAGASFETDPAAAPAWRPDSSELRLRAGDHVFIRKAVGYVAPQTVKVTGDVQYPGTYVLETREERIANVVRRAGGLTAEAYAPGLQLFRGGQLVATDLVSAMLDETSRYNLVLEPGDSLHIPRYDPTVLVTGAVAFETLVLYEPGRSLDYYVGRAGGYMDVADRDRVTVTYQDGERATAERRGLLFRSMPRVQPGSTIHVPEKPPSERGGFDLDRFLTRTTGILTSMLTLWLAIDKVGEAL